MTDLATLTQASGALALIGRTSAVGVGLIFAGAATGKLRHRALFPGVVANYRLLPQGLVAPVAMLLPWAELGLGCALLSLGVSGMAGPALPLASASAIALLLVFAWAMAINIARGRSHIDCGCGHSALRQPLGKPLVLRNILLGLLLVPASLPASTGLRAMPDAVPGAGWVALGGGFALFLLFHLFNAILALTAMAAPALRRFPRAEVQVR